MNRGVRAAAAAVALATTPLPAMASCWNAEETSAATVRELQSVLMVAALRCQAARIGFMEDYNGFLRANRYTIQQMNDRIKAHFIKTGGAVRGQVAYDAFATSLANNHGGDGANLEQCGAMGALAREAALMGGSMEGLLLLAARQGLVVALPEGPCRPATEMAFAAPAAAVAAATVAAAPAPVETAMAAPVAMPAAVLAPAPVVAAEGPPPRAYYAAPEPVADEVPPRAYYAAPADYPQQRYYAEPPRGYYPPPPGYYPRSRRYAPAPGYATAYGYGQAPLGYDPGGR